MYREEDAEDLRCEIFHLKKQTSKVHAENHLLKVKVRKLQTEIVKKDKDIDALLDPKKYLDVRKLLYERSASFVINIKEQNDQLLRMLEEKEIAVKRLQSQLEVTKIYSRNPKKTFRNGEFAPSKMEIPCFRAKSANSEDKARLKKKGKSLSWTGLHQESTLIEEMSAEEEREKFNMKDLKDQYKNLSKEHLLSIIENLKTTQRYSPNSRPASSRKSSPESDLERIELCESPHEEIQQLHLHFLDMISEVDHLKYTITQLQSNQEKTDNVLKKKDTSMDKLVQEIKSLKRPKSCRSKSGRCRKSINSNEVLARVYSAGVSTKNSKTCEKVDKSKSLKKTKDVEIQVDEIDSPVSQQCVYIEKGGVTVAQKEAVPVEKEYDDDFERDDESTN